MPEQANIKYRVPGKNKSVSLPVVNYPHLKLPVVIAPQSY